MIYVIGHKSPDSDSVCAAIAVAELKRALGEKCEARIAGKINLESRFILEKFGVEIPEILEDASGKEIILVDHTDLSQSILNMKDAEIVGIVDHHKLGDVSTNKPLEILVRPLGSTCTIVKRLFEYYEKKISKEIAGIMLCAILSDTVIFRSPTTTDEDRRVAEELAKVAKIEDLEKLGMEMFKVKSNIEGVRAKDLVMRDYKDFEMGGKKIGVGQLELVDLGMVDSIKSELIESMKELKNEGRYAVFLMLTDIMKKGSELLCVSDEEGLRERIFGENKEGWFEGMMSRRKQVVPKLEVAFGQ